MTVIDFHTHTFPDKIARKAIASLSGKSHSKPFTDGTVKGLKASMQRSGIDRSVILPVATSPDQVEKINTSAALLNQKHKGTLFSLGCIHPDYEKVEQEMVRIKELGLRGIKIHPVYQNTDLDDPRFLRIFRQAKKLDLVVVTHTGLDIGYPGQVKCSPQMARHVVEKVGIFRFVLAHMGGWRNWNIVPEILAGTGVYLDTAFSTGEIVPLNDGYWNEEQLPMMGEEEMMNLIRIFGSDHILFGTDSPWSSQSESLHFIQDLPLTKVEKEQILCQNARKLLQLEE
jgi:predicted TIM-barrel fold metal-dependent hydrolase